MDMKDKVIEAVVIIGTMAVVCGVWFLAFAHYAAEIGHPVL